jgi:hypothetical protein
MLVEIKRGAELPHLPHYPTTPQFRNNMPIISLSLVYKAPGNEPMMLTSPACFPRVSPLFSYDIHSDFDAF